MSDTTESLRRKIKSAKDLQSVVRTMKALAASSIGQYERAIRALEDYHRTVELGLHACLTRTHRIAREEADTGHVEIATRVAVVFGSDQGLVGRFNEMVGDYAVQNLSGPVDAVHVWAVGERVYSQLSDAGVRLIGRFGVPNSVKSIASLVGDILVDIEKHHADAEGMELDLFYNHPTSGALYAPVRQRLLPLDVEWRDRVAAMHWPTAKIPEAMGGRVPTLRAFVREYLFVLLFRACAESLASENASRLAAMQRADKNIDEMLEELNGRYHQFRQNGIDAELFDVVSGFEALGGQEQRHLGHG